MIEHPEWLAPIYRALLRLSKGRGAQTLARLDSVLLPMRRRVELGSGVMMELASDPHLFGYLLQVHEGHVKEWVVEYASRATTFVDVGANIGYFSGLAISLMPAGASICLLEPDLDNFQATVWTERAATARGIRLHRFHGAASDQEGELFLKRHPKFCTYHEVSSTAPTGGTPDQLRVAAVTLTGYLASRQLERIDCLKIDVEGHEEAVLRGAAELFEGRRISRAMIEVTPGPGVDLAFELGRAGGYTLHFWLDNAWQVWTAPGQIQQRLDVRFEAKADRL